MNTIKKWFFLLPTLMVLGSASAKIVGAENVVKQLTQAGLSNFILVLAAFEIVFCITWLYGKTRRIGFFLLCSYFGGAIATDLTHLEVIVAPIIILSLIWLATFWRDEDLFHSVAKK
ncbi:MAG: hypothetical protein ACKVOU_11135 [Cytophagales bacterium]